jgi:hypothetical protein
MDGNEMNPSPQQFQSLTKNFNIENMHPRFFPLKPNLSAKKFPQSNSFKQQVQTFWLTVLYNLDWRCHFPSVTFQVFNIVVQSYNPIVLPWIGWKVSVDLANDLVTQSTGDIISAYSSPSCQIIFRENSTGLPWKFNGKPHVLMKLTLVSSKFVLNCGLPLLKTANFIV